MKKISELSQSEFATAYREYSVAKRLAKKLEKERIAQGKEKMR